MVMETKMQAPDRFEESFEWLHETAMAQAGLSDFGDPEYHVG
jgi:hypothetical protein